MSTLQTNTQLDQNPDLGEYESLKSKVTFWFLRLRQTFWRHVFWSVVVFLSIVWVICATLIFHFEKNAANANITSFGEAMWWAIVTFLTVGYGDRYPITTEGRIIASFLMLAGVGSVGIITAKISSIFLEQALREGRGAVDSRQLKNHFIICGWNENMADLLIHILDFNPNLSSRDIVLAAQVTPAQFEALTSLPQLKELHVIVGDHFNETILRRAAPERARKVLILADRTPGPTGQIPTTTEIDARTIMTAMTISNITRGTLITAEILDPKMEHYLRLANVSEIVYSSEYSRLLLGNATSGTGIANIIFDLLDNKSGSHITTIPTEAEWVGKTFKETREIIESTQRDLLVIGILKNSGNSHSIREIALRRAQQTPNMNELVSNLKQVKQLRCNDPQFNPDPNSRIDESSMLIVISNRLAARQVAATGGARI